MIQSWKSLVIAPSDSLKLTRFTPPNIWMSASQPK